MKTSKTKTISPYKGKKIILGVCAGISLYKSISLLRLLVKGGADVKVIMTLEAVKFINPVFFSTFSNNKVYIDFVKGNKWENHVDLGLWADLMIVAPITANTLAKFANGYSDNFLIATYLSLKCDSMLFPSMDRDMYNHKSTQDNIKKLRSDNFVINPNSGELASGLVGEGRLPEPDEVISHVTSYFLNKNKLKNKKILITAGPTYEFIDSVRYISNLSSGKMGFSLAKTAVNMGAKVDLVMGPSSIDIRYKDIKLHKIISAQDMLNKVNDLFLSFDIIIMAAAVSDYRAKKVSKNKIKKDSMNRNLSLIKNKDILSLLGQNKKDNQILIGFALEDKNEIANAKKKLVQKNLDMIVLNSLNEKGAGFLHDTNSVKLILKNSVTSTGLDTKDNIANYILDFIYQEFLDDAKVNI